MWKVPADRTVYWGVWALLALGLAVRLVVLIHFGFRYIGIDDALIQQVAIDYGHGIFREPFLYGQNYNPMLEALLAAPFVRIGADPWIVLPIVTSLLALWPFWSCALWCQRKGFSTAALLIAATPLLLPLEWDLITTQSRGFVHGLALLGFVPWTQGIRRLFPRFLLTSLVLALSIWCNPNTAPVVAGIVVWLSGHHFRSKEFWITGIAGLGLLFILHQWSQTYYADHPERLIHPLTTSDLAFSADRILNGLRHFDQHILHVIPFASIAAGTLPVLLVLGLAFLIRRGRTLEVFSLFTIAICMILALGILKVHEGCTSVFFPKSRMFLALPLILGVLAAMVAKDIRIGSTWMLACVVVLAASTVFKVIPIDSVIQRELVEQDCAYVREEPIALLRERCALVSKLAEDHHADLVVPIRWPGIRVDHRAHFQAHFTCYACPVLTGFPPVYGAGYDRRTWLRNTYGGPAPGRVLFVGGDPNAWARAEAEHAGIERIGDRSIELHMIQSDTASVERIITALGVDDDLGR